VLTVEEYAARDAVGLRALLAAGEVTSGEVEAIARRALVAANRDLNALTGPLFESALDADPTGPLAGVPFLIKDSEPFARGVSFTLGSRSVSGARATADHPLMASFRTAGLVTIGQTTTPEWSLNFATESVRYGPTRNPWDLARGSGGSSGGAAALVAAGAVPVAHASDGAGSIRIPASCCGLVGLKPGRGTVAPPGSIGEPLGVDFVLTRTVRDSQLFLDLLGGAPHTKPAPDRSDSSDPALPHSGLRIALATAAWSGVPVDAEVASTTEAVASMLEWIGYDVTAAAPQLHPADITAGTLLGLMNAGRAILGAPIAPRTELLETASRAILADAATFGGPRAERSLHAQRTITATVERFFEHFDVLITPTVAQLPPVHGTLDYNAPDLSSGLWLDRMLAFGPFTAPFNVSGHPAISLPLGQSANGLPIGVQLVAARGGERVLLALAADLEQAVPWASRLPPVWVD
jgi:amidase